MGSVLILTLVIDEEMPVNWRRIPQNFLQQVSGRPLQRGRT
jgi:hypothetical protein